MSKSNIRAYGRTQTPWTVTQGQITKMLNEQKIFDIQFTTISANTAGQSGLKMDANTVAIMVVFQKEIALPDGRNGNVPVRIIVPNVRDSQMNQYYRMLFWYIKSKFEAIDTGLVEFAEEFMAHLQINDKHGISRLWDRFRKGFYKAIGNGDMPGANLLPPTITDEEDDKDTN